MHKFSDGASLIYPLNNYIYIINSDGIQKDVFIDFGEKETSKMNAYIERLKQENITAHQLGDKGDAQPDFFCLADAICCNDLFCFVYSNYKQHSAGIGFYYPQTNTYIGGRYSLKNDIDGGIPIMPIAACENKLYTVIESYMLENIPTTTIQLTSLKKKINEDSN